MPRRQKIKVLGVNPFNMSPKKGFQYSAKDKTGAWLRYDKMFKFLKIRREK
jgi:hypothetical protein